MRGERRTKEGAVKAKIHVILKQGILDPQGKAIEHALDSLGFKNAGNVRVGKYMEVDVNETDKVKADAAVKAMCEKLLAHDLPLQDPYRDHAVIDEWKNFRDCHIKPDLVLIYQKPDDKILQLVRIGSHGELGL